MQLPGSRSISCHSSWRIFVVNLEVPEVQFLDPCPQTLAIHNFLTPLLPWRPAHDVDDGGDGEKEDDDNGDHGDGDQGLLERVRLLHCCQAGAHDVG